MHSPQQHQHDAISTGGSTQPPGWYGVPGSDAGSEHSIPPYMPTPQHQHQHQHQQPMWLQVMPMVPFQMAHMGYQQPQQPQRQQPAKPAGSNGVSSDQPLYERARAEAGGGVGLHIDRIPLDTLTKDIALTIKQELGSEVLHIEDKRGQKTVHCCAYAIVSGNPDFGGRSEVHRPLRHSDPYPGEDPHPDGTGSPGRTIRIQRASRCPERPVPCQPCTTLHIRVMTQRRNWSFAISGLSWIGLAGFLETVSPGSAKNVLLVADDRSEKTARSHPENFICGFFVECRDMEASAEVLSKCGDRRVVVDGVPFRVAAEYTRKRNLRLYDKQPKGQPDCLRHTMQQQFDEARNEGTQIAQYILAGEHVPVQLADPAPPRGAAVRMFRLMCTAESVHKPQWYQRRLQELGFHPHMGGSQNPPAMRVDMGPAQQQPPEQQPLRAVDPNKDILEPFLKSIGLSEYHSMLRRMSATSYHDLAELDHELLQSEGMTDENDRRTLLAGVNQLYKLVVLRSDPLSNPAAPNPQITPVGQQPEAPSDPAWAAGEQQINPLELLSAVATEQPGQRVHSGRRPRGQSGQGNRMLRSQRSVAQGRQDTEPLTGEARLETSPMRLRQTLPAMLPPFGVADPTDIEDPTEGATPPSAGVHSATHSGFRSSLPAAPGQAVADALQARPEGGAHTPPAHTAGSPMPLSPIAGAGEQHPICA
eukprot:TRINITY_DN34812_c0_g1_i1.p1 TRINITY_DN34812_c0_g1~~TRINITY_DN34812_c0_g1_i1.p1  ORF type:complete len:702 (+),score=186.64 TRINITY_DN34812_c0_g1_i1:95-2200(+)